MRIPSRLRVPLCVLAAGLLLLAACGDDSSDPAGAESTTREFTDDTGEAIQIPVEPQSVVACGYAVLPLIQAEANLSAVCEWSRELDNMDEETLAAYEALPKVAVDGDASSINYEAVAAAEPDLIILGVPARAVHDVNMDALRDLAPVLVLAPSAPTEWRELGERYADAAGVADAYGAGRAEYEALVAEINDEYADLFSELTFGAVCTPCGVFDGTIFREFAGSYMSNLFDDLDAEFPGSPANPEDVHGEDVSFEFIPTSLGDVDVIAYGVQADGSPEPGMEELFESPLWKQLPAVQQGRVIEVRHHSAATYRTAIPALESIRDQLAALPAG